MKKHDNALAFVRDVPLAAEPRRLQAAIASLMSGGITGAFGQPQTKPTQSGHVAILPLRGALSQHRNPFTELLGGTDLDTWARTFGDMVSASHVSAIILDIDSPGGPVYGVPELAERIFRARGAKPIVAVANSEMFSGAYWLGSAASSVYVTPSGATGSIGVWALHMDVSKMQEQVGIKASYIFAGERKVIGNPYEPLSDEAKDLIQAEVDSYYEQFVAAVAKHRRTTPETVRRGYGRGFTATAEQSVRIGLADDVASLDQVIAMATKNKTPASFQAAMRERELRRFERSVTSGGSWRDEAQRRNREIRELELAILERAVCTRNGAFGQL